MKKYGYISSPNGVIEDTIPMAAVVTGIDFQDGSIVEIDDSKKHAADVREMNLRTLLASQEDWLLRRGAEECSGHYEGVVCHKPASGAVSYKFRTIVAAAQTQDTAYSAGKDSVACCCDDKSHAVTVDLNSCAVATGEESTAVALSWQSVAATTNYHSVAIASGLDSIAAATGTYSLAASMKSGCVAVAAANSGAVGMAPGAIAFAAGYTSRAKGVVGSFLLFTVYEQGRGRRDNKVTGVKTFFVDGEKIKENTWYMLKDGELIESQQKNGSLPI